MMQMSSTQPQPTQQNQGYKKNGKSGQSNLNNDDKTH
jgi:hypothetical protein